MRLRNMRQANQRIPNKNITGALQGCNTGARVQRPSAVMPVFSPIPAVLDRYRLAAGFFQIFKSCRECGSLQRFCSHPGRKIHKKPRNGSLQGLNQYTMYSHIMTKTIGYKYTVSPYLAKLLGVDCFLQLFYCVQDAKFSDRGMITSRPDHKTPSFHLPKTTL